MIDRPGRAECLTPTWRPCRTDTTTIGWGRLMVDGLPLRFCSTSQSGCHDATMYLHPIHVDVFRLRPKE